MSIVEQVAERQRVTHAETYRNLIHSVFDRATDHQRRHETAWLHLLTHEEKEVLSGLIKDGFVRDADVVNDLDQMKLGAILDDRIADAKREQAKHRSHAAIMEDRRQHDAAAALIRDIIDAKSNAFAEETQERKSADQRVEAIESQARGLLGNFSGLYRT